MQNTRPSDRELFNRLREAKESLKNRHGLFANPAKVVGELNALGTPEELLRRPPTLFAANFVGAVNLFPATVERSEGETRLTAGPITVQQRSDEAGNYLMVLPDEIALLPANAATGPNLIAGEVSALIDEGNYVRVLVRAGGLAQPLAVYLTRQAVRAQSLEIGSLVTADVRNALHVLRE